MDTPKKRGRPKQTDIQNQVVEIIKEIIVEVPVKELQNFELYQALKRAGMPQGGIGQWMEDPNGIEKVYLPHASEIYASFAQNPDGWDIIRDYLARAYIALQSH